MWLGSDESESPAERRLREKRERLERARELIPKNSQNGEVLKKEGDER